LKVYKVNMDGSNLTELNIPGLLDNDDIAVNDNKKRICITSKCKRHDITKIDMAYVLM